MREGVPKCKGKASRMILHAIAEGESDPQRLVAFVVGRMRAEPKELEAALVGKVTHHHRFLLKEHLTQITHLDLAIERVTAEIVRRFTPPPSPQEPDKQAQLISLSYPLECLYT